jgi:hypothetical protein
MTKRKHVSALEWGQRNGSCEEALVWRRSLGPKATQADAWRLCQRGDWMLWQWRRLPAAARGRTQDAMRRALCRIVARAIRRVPRTLRGNHAPWALQWRRWAREWLDGSNCTEMAASSALSVASAAWGEARGKASWAARSASEAARAAAAAADASSHDTWEDESWAEAVAAASRSSSAWAAELRLQARDIRAEIPEWPGVGGGSCRSRRIRG